jgi:hypothetical protein
MIDTIVLTLDKDMFYITEPDKFEPSARWVNADTGRMGSRAYITSKQNPTKAEFLKGIYKPRLTITKRFNQAKRFEVCMKIELSLPKLIFGNNFDELQNADFESISIKLHERLKEMGVRVFRAILIKAPVSAVHYSKNILLTDGTTPYHYIKKIREANITLALDINQTDYRNDGHSFKWHCNSYEVAFYDKIKDLEVSKKSEKRAIEKDNAVQLGLFDTLPRRKPFEVLRMEARLNKRQKICQMFEKLKINSELTFQDVFDARNAQLVLLHYLGEMERQRPALLDRAYSDPQALLADIVVSNPSLGVKRALQAFGLKQALDKIGMRELRKMLSKFSNRSWYRLVQDIKQVKLAKRNDTFGVIHKQLLSFTPLKLADLQTAIEGKKVLDNACKLL